MERQKARWRHAGCANVRDCRDWVLQMTLKKLSHFMWHLKFFWADISTSTTSLLRGQSYNGKK